MHRQHTGEDTGEEFATDIPMCVMINPERSLRCLGKNKLPVPEPTFSGFCTSLHSLPWLSNEPYLGLLNKTPCLGLLNKTPCPSIK